VNDVPDRELIETSNSLLRIWDMFEYQECHHRRAFGELLYRCSHAILVFELFTRGHMSVDDLKSAIMRCVTPSDILKCYVDDLQGQVTDLENGE